MIILCVSEGGGWTAAFCSGGQVSTEQGRDHVGSPVSSELLSKANALGRRIPSVVTCKHLSPCALGASQVTPWGSQA